MFLATDADKPPFEMAKGTWIAANRPAIVIRADVAERRGIELDDTIVAELEKPTASGKTELSLTVVGIVSAPSLPGAEAVGIPMLTPSSGEAFITSATMEQLTGEPTRIRLVGLSIDPQADINQFRFGWAPKLSRFSTPVQFQEAFEIEEALDQAAAAQNVRMQSYAATGVAMLVAMLVIFCSLSMGVTERIRQYAVLRAIFMTRGQVGALIAIEGIAFGLLGLVVGIGLGWVVLRMIEASYSRLLYHGVALGTWSLSLASVAAIGGAFLASMIPAYRAMRVKPLDAMNSSHADAGESTMPWRAIVLGLLLIAVNPLLTFVFPPSESSVFLAMGVGFGCMSIGFILVAPLVVRVVDRWLSPVLARVLSIDAKLLSSQITSNLWRTVGASIAMAFGLGLFIGIQVWGFTMLEAFIPGDWTPDAIVEIKPGLPAEQAARIASLPGVDNERCLPMVVEQPRLVEDITGSAERASVTRQDNVVIVGLDPTGAFSGDRPLLQLDWVAGDRESAVTRMLEGHACVVPDHFLAETGLKIGDTIALDPPKEAGNSAVYTIVGAVRLPGWHWQTKLTGLRPRTHRAAALVFADYASVASDFSLDVASHVWFSYADDDVDPDQVGDEVTASLQQAMSEADKDSEISARVVAVQGIRNHLDGAARRWIWVISQVPLISLLIACLGVLNVLLASVRSRRWEFGVLRAIGFTSHDLTRAILAEGLLIGAVAGLLSVGFGVMGGWCGGGMAQYISFFGGLHPPLVIPWTAIGIGLCLVMMLGFLTAAWPAISIGRTRPMRLLEQGREFT